MGHGSLVPPMVPSLRNVLKWIKYIGLQRKSVILKSYSSYENSGESRRINRSVPVTNKSQRWLLLLILQVLSFFLGLDQWSWEGRPRDPCLRAWGPLQGLVSWGMLPWTAGPCKRGFHWGRGGTPERTGPLGLRGERPTAGLAWKQGGGPQRKAQTQPETTGAFYGPSAFHTPDNWTYSNISFASAQYVWIIPGIYR